MDDDLLVGRYQRRRPLGSGGMGDVWLAEDLELGREVAVKRLRFGSPAGLDAELVERMQREARVVARLKHPAIVTLHDLVRVEGRPFLIMEYVEGESLADRIGRLGALSWAEVAPVVADIAGALAAAHRAGVLHRDVKPANVLLDLEGGGHLADFGIARGIEDAAITRAGELVGTVAYMPPEVARDNLATAAGDVWSLGATFYAAVEGAAPFAESGASVPSIINKLIHEESPPPRSAGPCNALLTRMLAADHTLRPSAAEVEQEIRRLLVVPVPPPAPVTRESSLPTEVSPVTTRPDVAPPTEIARAPRAPGATRAPRRGRWVVGLVVLLLVLGGAGAALLALGALGGDDDTPPDEAGPSGSTTPSATPSATTYEIGAGPRRLELASEADGPLYVANELDDSVSVIDLVTGEVTEIPVCKRPLGTTVAPDASLAYVRCSGSEISVVDARREVKRIPLEESPGPLRIDATGERLYVPVSNGTVAIVDTVEGVVTDALSIGTEPGLVHISPDGTTAWTPDPASGIVARIDTRTKTAAPVTLAAQPNGLQVSEDGARVYVTLEGGQVQVVDGTADVDTGGDVYALPGPTSGRIRLQPGTELGWIPHPDEGVVWVLDLETGRLVTTVDVGGTTGDIMLFDEDGTTAYVPDYDAGDVLVVDTTDFTVTRLAAGDSPRNLALSRDGATLYAVGLAGGDDARGTVTAVPLG